MSVQKRWALYVITACAWLALVIDGAVDSEFGAGDAMVAAIAGVLAICSVLVALLSPMIATAQIWFTIGSESCSECRQQRHAVISGGRRASDQKLRVVPPDAGGDLVDT